jgi:PAS domain S-box-containing protein
MGDTQEQVEVSRDAAPPEGGAGQSDAEREQDVYAEQVKLLYTQIPLGLVGTVFNAVLLAAIQWPVIAPPVVLAWLAYIVILTAARGILIYRYRTAAPPPAEARRWGWWGIAGAALSGLGWGAAGVLLFPEESTIRQVFLAFVLGGMASGGAIILSSVALASWAFIVPVLLPVTVKFFTSDSEVALAMGTMGGLFMLVTLATAQWMHRTIARTLALRFKNRRLIAYLTRARSVLASEIAVRRKSEDTLRETLNTLQALVRGAPLAIDAVDLKGNVTLWNPASERMLGWAASEVLGEPLPTVPVERRHEIELALDKAARGESLAERETMRQKKDGTVIDVSLSTAGLRNAGGEVVGVMSILSDITERKRMEQHAKRMEKLALLGQLLGGIAHELKNPLFILTGHLQLLRDKLANQEYEALPGDVQKIEAAAERMTYITERFLHLAMPSQPRRERCSVRAVLQQTLDFLDNELMKNQIKVRTAFHPSLPIIQSDSRQLQDVFLNLVLNAMQAMASAHGHGTLTVAAGRAGDWVEVRIQDDGPGIAPEHRPRLFEPFFSTKPPDQGTGLGLWTVRSVVMALGGTVEYETEEELGTTFLVKLPIGSSGTPPA